MQTQVWNRLHQIEKTNANYWNKMKYQEIVSLNLAGYNNIGLCNN